jgi:flagellar motility protein MotE (MotC chaperone)
MKIRSLPSRLAPLALCAVIAMLLVKLAISAGNLIARNQAGLAAPDVIAEEVKTEVQSGRSGEGSLPGLAGVAESQAAPPPADKEKPKSVKGSSLGEALTLLQQKESDIKRREEQVREKEDRVAKIEKEVEQKLQELIALQKEMQAYRNEKQESQNTRVRNLSKIYGTMKPKEAAKLMENLDDKLVMGIISTMSPEEAASILAVMEVKKAAKISEALSGR